MNQLKFNNLREGRFGCPSELLLDQLVAEALVPMEKQAALLHITGCEQCEERVRVRRVGMRAFPFLDEDRLYSAILKRLGEPRSRSPAATPWTGEHRNPIE